MHPAVDGALETSQRLAVSKEGSAITGEASTNHRRRGAATLDQAASFIPDSG
jgi:hypothetical protein